MLVGSFKEDLDPVKIFKQNKNNIPVLHLLLTLFGALNTIYGSVSRGSGSGMLDGATDILRICLYLTIKVGHFGLKSVSDLMTLMGSRKLI